MPFEFATAGRILFGDGAVRELAPAAAAMGRRPLVVCGAHRERVEPFLAGIDAAWCCVAGEPSVELVLAGTQQARAENCDMVIAIGGGSVIDAGKAIAALLANPGDPFEYLEVVGRGKPIPNLPAPCIAVPTTAGTGSEVTRNAVLASTEHRVKASLRHASMIPRVAIVDPELTLDLPPAITASTGLDALTQLIEPYVSAKANAMTDLYAVDGIRRAALALPRAFADGHDREARKEMAWCSLLGGLSLANAGLGAVHGFAAPIGGMFPAPHGAVCAAVLPFAMEINVRALRQRLPDGDGLRRFHEVARLLTGSPSAIAEDGVFFVRELCRKLGILPLRTYGVGEADLPVLVEKAAKANSMKANPIALTPSELLEMIAGAV